MLLYRVLRRLIGGEPGTPAPNTDVRRVIEYALQKLPRGKVILGMPLYGYNWTIPHQPGTIATAHSNQSAVEGAMRFQTPIHYSTEF